LILEGIPKLSGLHSFQHLTIAHKNIKNINVYALQSLDLIIIKASVAAANENKEVQ